MDDLQFYILFNSISVISEQWVGNERLCDGTHLQLNRFLLQAGLEPKTARSVGQHLTHWATEAPSNSQIQKILQFAHFVLLRTTWTITQSDQKLSSIQSKFKDSENTVNLLNYATYLLFIFPFEARKKISWT